MPCGQHPSGRQDCGLHPGWDTCCPSTLSYFCKLRSCHSLSVCPVGRLLFARVVRFARDYRLCQLAIFCDAARTIARDVLARFRSGETGQRLVLAAAVTGPAGGDQVARIVAAALRIGDQMVQRDIGGGSVVQIPAAVQAGEAVTQVDRQPQIGADAHALVFAVAASVICRVAVFAHFVFPFALRSHSNSIVIIAQTLYKVKSFFTYFFFA